MSLIEKSEERRHNDRGWVLQLSNGPAFDLKAASNRFFRILAALTLLLFLASGVRSGWNRTSGDFSNYFTAAYATRHGEPLRDLYDWTRFDREINFAGFERTMGGYQPQTPLSMLPFVPLTNLAPQNAKRIWLIFNCLFLVATLWMLSLITGFSIDRLWLLAFCGFFPLYDNFVGGQYYVCLLFLLTLCIYSLNRRDDFLSGSMAGVAFALKLYGGPLLLFFLAKRRPKAVVGMIVTSSFLLLLALWIFGARDIYYYASQVLPRGLDGEPINPYYAAVPALPTLLKHLFIAEPGLNPHPLWNAPWLSYFLQTLISAGILVFLFLGASTKRFTERRDYAWFIIGALLLSTSTSSYTYVLLLLPLVLLLSEANRRESVLLFAAYALLAFPLPAGWFFAKLWILMALFLGLSCRRWWQLSRRVSLAAAAVVILAAFLAAQSKMASYAGSPTRLCEPVAPELALFSGFPVVSRAGLFYQSMEGDRFVLRWLHNGRKEVLRFDGLAIYPRLAPDGESIHFELVANRASKGMLFDPATRKATPQSAAIFPDVDAPAASPDGRWSAFASAQTGSEQIWIRNLASGKQLRLTGGNCNNSSPAWELDSQSIIFASDCNRAFGLPALYRARIPHD
jgi:hypothetical protein